MIVDLIFQFIKYNTKNIPNLNLKATPLNKPDLDKGLIFVVVFLIVYISFFLYLLFPSDLVIDSVGIHEELNIIKVDFAIGDSSSGKIIVQVTNLVDFDITVSEIRINSEKTNSWKATNPTVTVDATETFTITHEITAGNKYGINLFTKEGRLIGSYTKTA